MKWKYSIKPIDEDLVIWLNMLETCCSLSETFVVFLTAYSTLNCGHPESLMIILIYHEVFLMCVTKSPLIALYPDCMQPLCVAIF